MVVGRDCLFIIITSLSAGREYGLGKESRWGLAVSHLDDPADEGFRG